MKRIIATVLVTGALTFAGELVADAELEEIYAGITYASDVVFRTSTLSGGGGLSGTSPYNLTNSVFIDGNAQQNAFAPINAANSAVSQAINIVIITGQVNGNVDIDFNNNLNADITQIVQ